MPTLKIDIDQPTYEHLVSLAVSESRPVAWEAAILLRRVLGLLAGDVVPCEAIIDQDRIKQMRGLLRTTLRDADIASQVAANPPHGG